MLEFSVIERGGYIPAVEKNKAFLRADGWNDYSFVTMFYLTVFDEHGEKCDIGNVKIGFVGQKEEVSTYSLIDKKFSQLPEMFFSLGESIDYYVNLSKLSDGFKHNLLKAIQDLVVWPNRLADIENESVLNTSLLRGVTLSEIHGQFARVLNGLPELSDFHFSFNRKSALLFLVFALFAVQFSQGQKILGAGDHTLILCKEIDLLSTINDNELYIRDSLMAENIGLMTSTLFPDKKIIFLAHNAHVAKNYNSVTGSLDGDDRTMVSFLNKKTADNSVVIALYGIQGETNNNKRSPVKMTAAGARFHP